MAPRMADKLRLSQTYLRYVTGIGSHTSSQRVSFLCMSSWEYRFPHVLARGVVPLHVLANSARCLHCAPTVSFVGSSRKGYAPCTTVLSWWVGFDLRVAGCYPAPLFYIVCFLWWGHCMWCGVGHSFVVGVGA